MSTAGGGYLRILPPGPTTVISTKREPCRLLALNATRNPPRSVPVLSRASMYLSRVGSLPALRNDEPFGTATGASIKIATRDTGQFLDPRTCKDWWMDYFGECRTTR